MNHNNCNNIVESLSPGPQHVDQQLVEVMNETVSVNDFSKEEDLSTDEDEEEDDSDAINVHQNNKKGSTSSRPTLNRAGLSRRESSKKEFGVKPCGTYFTLSIASNVGFVVASCCYLALAARELDYNISVQDLSDNVLNADDDYTWNMEAPFVGDDYVFAVKNDSVWVSHYQMLYFSGALCFVISGLLDCIKEPGWLGVTLILAGCFGLISAMLVEKNAYQSAIFNSVSVHLFLLDAVGLFFSRGAAGAIFANNPTLQRYVRLGDVFWIMGTLIDVVLSYYYVFETDGLIHAQMAVFAATLWLACSLIYITATSHVECQGRQLYNRQRRAPVKEPPSSETPSTTAHTTNHTYMYHADNDQA
jgi:hypothetical protein